LRQIAAEAIDSIDSIQSRAAVDGPVGIMRCRKHGAWETTAATKGRIASMRTSMRTRTSNLVPLTTAAVSLVALTGCEPGPAGSTVTIRYSQVGACDGYLTGTGLTAKRPNQAFVVFKIEALDGTKSGVEFNFVPSRLFVDLEPHKETWGSSLGAGRYFVSSDRRYTDPLGATPLKEMRAPARATTEVDRLAFVAVATAASVGSEEASRTSYHLLYDPETGKESGNPPDPHIAFAKSNDTQTTWQRAEDCLHLDIGAKK
jgi:hypothetical protein